MDALAFLWLFLTILELTNKLPAYLDMVSQVIWGIFVVYFIVELLLAPKKKVYLKHNVLTVISLLVPALRILRFLRFFRVVRLMRGSSLVRIFGATSRGMKSLQNSFAKKAMVYVFALTLVVILTGAAGILSFEDGYSNYFTGFGSALWWSGMMVTTMGSDYFPKSPEGRILGFSLAVYGFAIFGYVAAAIGSLFLFKNAKREKDSVNEELRQLKAEIKSLKELLEKAIPTSSDLK
jgi:voltage-gated potassium channel